jgi:hypothetical protein
MALLNIITQYKMGRMSRGRFRRQIFLWIAILIVLVCSYPAYNHISGNPLFKSSDLSLLDIVQTTVIIYLIYIINNQRRKIEQNERFVRDLHQELSIKLASKESKK